MQAVAVPSLAINLYYVSVVAYPSQTLDVLGLTVLFVSWNN
jgi:hypothetical protein